MPNIQRPLRFKCPRISNSLIRYGYKPHLPVQERRELLKELVEVDPYGPKAIWYKLDQLALSNFNNINLNRYKINTQNRVYNIVKRDRNWVRKTYLSELY